MNSWRFILFRPQGEPDADGVEFADHAVVLRFRDQPDGPKAFTAIFPNLLDVQETYREKDGNKVVWEPRDAMDREAYWLGEQNCLQDYAENCPFASVGGLEKRKFIEAPKYALDKGEVYAGAYLRGYRATAHKIWGPDWRTVSFSWMPAVTIHSSK